MREKKDVNKFEYLRVKVRRAEVFIAIRLKIKWILVLVYVSPWMFDNRIQFLTYFHNECKTNLNVLVLNKTTCNLKQSTFATHVEVIKQFSQPWMIDRFLCVNMHPLTSIQHTHYTRP